MPDWTAAVRAHVAAAGLDPQSEAAVIDELTQHLDDCYRELSASGLPEDECRSRVLAELEDADCNRERLRPRTPAAAAVPLGTAPSRHGNLTGVTHDLKVAFRGLRSQPVFSLTVILMLASGIAGNAA